MKNEIDLNDLDDLKDESPSGSDLLTFIIF